MGLRIGKKKKKKRWLQFCLKLSRKTVLSLQSETLEHVSQSLTKAAEHSGDAASSTWPWTKSE